MKTSIKIALFVVFFIALAGILAALYIYNQKQPDTAKARPDFTITAVQLQKDFEDNEKKASSMYIDKILEVSGTIASIKQVHHNAVNISLFTGSDVLSVICTFPEIDDLSRYKPGDKIILMGKCSGMLLDVLLNNCSVIKQGVSM